MPVIGIGALVSAVTIPLNDQFLSKSHFASRKILREIGIRTPAAYIEAGTFVKEFEGYIIFVHEIKGNTLRNIRIYQPQENRPTRTITAKQGEFISVPKKGLVKLKMIDGTSEEPDLTNPSHFYKLNFKTYYMTLNLQDKPKPQRLDKKPREMTIHELRTELKKMGQEGIEPEPLLSELHKKFAIPFSALVFVLIGMPLAIRTGRGERSISIGISFGILVIYWVLLAAGAACAIRGFVPPWFGIWFPNMAIGLVGVGLFINLMRK
ncbi:MAG: LptF/LptG family permease [Candidatus Omnitrophota bacterium]